MELLTGHTRAYPWGSRRAIAQMRGEETPTAAPEAELWFGAHPADPATIDGVGLDAIIAADPVAALGPDTAARFDDSLPFLLKILAAGSPLSLQAHPSQQQAADGFAAENDLGIEVTAWNRNYKDPNHKPELIVALTRFVALAGFRPVTRTRDLFAALSVAELDNYTQLLDGDEQEGLRALFTTWITVPAAARSTLVESVAAAARRVVAQPSTYPQWIVEESEMILGIAEHYPNDAGVLCALLLNHVVLEPGQGLFLAAGQMHAYVEGLGVEIMANSDNVLRGGLTSKHIDVPELVKVLTFEPLLDTIVSTTTDGVVTAYDTPAPEFRLSTAQLDAGQGIALPTERPAVVLCTAGTVTCAGESTTREITPTQAVWVPASDGPVRVTGPGQVFIATPAPASR